MRIFNPAVYHQDVALVVPEGDLVNVDTQVISLYLGVLKN